MDENQEFRLRQVGKIHDRLNEVQLSSPHNSLFHTDPQRVVEVAVGLMEGKPKNFYRKKYGMRNDTITEIKLAFMEPLEEYRLYHNKKLKVAMTMTEEIALREMASIQETQEAGGEVDLDKIKGIKELSIAAEKFQGSMLRLEDGVDKKILVEEKKSASELQAELQEMFNSIPKADIVDE